MKNDALGMRRPKCAAGRLQIDCRLQIEGVAGQGQAGTILRAPPGTQAPWGPPPPIRDYAPCNKTSQPSVLGRPPDPRIW